MPYLDVMSVHGKITQKFTDDQIKLFCALLSRPDIENFSLRVSIRFDKKFDHIFLKRKVPKNILCSTQ